MNKHLTKGKICHISLKELNRMFYTLIIILDKFNFEKTRRATKFAYEIFMEEISSKLKNP